MRRLVVYGTPTTINGAQPVTVVCVPPSGSTFAVGATPVTGETGRAALALREALDTHRATTMSGDQLEVNVTFDESG